MKLYYYPGACSMAVHIVLREAGFKFEIDQVDLAAQRTAAGEDYKVVNPKGYVPALRLDDGTVLTEVAVILQYLADLKPRRALAPKPRTPERYRLMEWLNFIATEIHKSLGAFFNPRMTPEWREAQVALVGKRFDFLERVLGASDYLMDDFSIADAYLYTVLNWTRLHRIDTVGWPNIQSYMRRIADRPTVKRATKAEGIET